MAEIVDAFPVRERHCPYPLDTWFNGKVWKLTKGKDFSARPRNVTLALKRYAKGRGLYLKCYSPRDTELFIQTSKTPFKK